jgi:hypothetical protein
MKKITCPCGAEFKTHTADELVEIANIHVTHVHKKDYPQGLPRDEVLKMVQDA